MKVFVVGPWMGAAVEHLFKRYNWELTRKLKEADLIQFTGGSDIHPALYGKPMHPNTYCSPERDKYELMVFAEGMKYKKPMAGICRGAQLLNVLCGGSMWQHVDNHNSGDHKVRDELSGEVFEVNSIHHQMMKPSDDAIVLAYAHEATKKEDCHEAGKSTVLYYPTKSANPGDPEIVIYWKDDIPMFCFQGHPEFAGENLQNRYMHYLDDYLFDGKQYAKGFK